VLPALQSLIALQALDSAAESQRKRLGEMPAAEQAIEAALTAARQQVDAGKAKFQANSDARRALEKDVAAIDTRLSRFEDHKAAVKTNHEYTALLHEIATAKTEKDGLEERLLVLMEEADTFAADVKTAERELADETKRSDAARTALVTERKEAEAELARLARERAAATAALDARTLAQYEQLLKGRRGIAVARMTGEICGACHVRLRPHVTQQIRRNDSLVQCDSCQRILYFVPPPAAAVAEG
jgi:predicted  nucleic acid-binding Zn-ribbon protein